MNWKEFLTPNKKKIILMISLVFLLIASYMLYYSTNIVIVKKLFSFAGNFLLYPAISFLRIADSINPITIFVSILIDLIYLYLISSLVFLPYRSISSGLFNYASKNWLSILIVLIISTVTWFLLVQIFSQQFTSGAQILSFVPAVLTSVVIYKIAEKMFNLQKLRMFVIVALSIIGYIISWEIFFLLPECGYSFSGLGGSVSVACECKGIKIEIDTSAALALDSYSSRTVCIGYGKSLEKVETLFLEEP